MKIFDSETFDISTISNATIAELGDVLKELMCERSKEQRELDSKFKGVYDGLVESLNPQQQKQFNLYQEQIEADQCLAEQRQFICGFKTAMRLTWESMK